MTRYGIAVDADLYVDAPDAETAREKASHLLDTESFVVLPPDDEGPVVEQRESRRVDVDPNGSAHAALSVLSRWDEPASSNDIKHAYAEYGYSTTSASPALTELEQAGLVETTNETVPYLRQITDAGREYIDEHGVLDPDEHQPRRLSIGDADA